MRLKTFTLAALLGLSFQASAQSNEEPKPQSKSLPKVKLTQPKSCGDLKAKMVDNLVEQMVNSYYAPRYRYGYGYGYGYGIPTPEVGLDAAPTKAATAKEPSMPAPSAKGDVGGMGASKSADAGPSRYTKTNTQERGVDEIDFVKTDGKHIYLLQGDELSIFQSWPVQDTKKIGSFKVKSGEPYNLFLYKDRVALVSTAYAGTDGFSEKLNMYGSGSRVTILDVSDRTNPKEIRHIDIDGYINNGRMIGDEVYFILESYLGGSYEFEDAVWNNFPETLYNAIDEINLSGKNSKSELRKIFRPYVQTQAEKFDVEKTLPLMQQTIGGVASDVEPLIDCDNFYRPNNLFYETSVMGVMHLDLGDDKSQPSASGVLGYGWTMYASTESLYLATDSSFWDYYVTDPYWDPYYYKPATDIHKFTLSKDGVKYAATGRVTGYLLNQFSMSEHKGNLRVATTDWDNPTGTKNYLSIFSQNGSQLTKVGSINNIAPGEEIQSVRMIGDKGYLVTFEQVDPLFTMDLSDPTKPKIVGELKIPGFSSYLHPIDKNHLLAVGMDGTESGQITGVQVSIFDVSDFANPKQKHKYTITQDGWGSSSEAQWDHKAFTYMGGYLVLPVTTAKTNKQGYYQQQTELVVMKASAKDGFEQLGTIDHNDFTQAGNAYNYYGYTALRRSIIIENTIFSISNLGLKVNDLKVPAEVYASIEFAKSVVSSK